MGDFLKLARGGVRRAPVVRNVTNDMEIAMVVFLLPGSVIAEVENSCFRLKIRFSTKLVKSGTCTVMGPSFSERGRKNAS